MAAPEAAPPAPAAMVTGATIFSLPPERQLSIQSAAGVDRQLSTHSAPSVKCFPVEFMENSYFTMPIAQPPIVSLRRKVRFQIIN